MGRLGFLEFSKQKLVFLRVKNEQIIASAANFFDRDLFTIILKNVSGKREREQRQYLWSRVI